MADSQRKSATGNKQGSWSDGRRPYTGQDDQFIRDNYLVIPSRAIAAALNRSRPSVYRRASQLGCQCGTFRVSKETQACKQCGREFAVRRSTPRKYCSLACAYASKDRIVERPKDRGFRTCACCNKTWKVTTRNQGRLTYCSSACCGAARTRTMAMETRNCIICKKAFQTRTAAPLKTCSPKCRNVRRSDVTLNTHLNSPPSSPRYSNRKSGRRADLGGLFFRSAWEANYARYLNALITIGQVESWRHEPRVFVFPSKRGARSYRPDFEVVTTGGVVEYHEVKGYDYPRGKSCRRKMKRYYPKEKVVLVDKKEYEPIARAFRRVLPQWES